MTEGTSCQKPLKVVTVEIWGEFKHRMAVPWPDPKYTYCPASIPSTKADSNWLKGAP